MAEDSNLDTKVRQTEKATESEGVVKSPADHIYLNPDFLDADNAIEALHSILHYTQSKDFLTETTAKLEAIYRRGSDEVRYKVITNLIDIEYTGSLPLLVEALQSDDSPLVRHEAAFGLGILGDSSYSSILTYAILNDDNLMVRHEAAIALAEMGGDAALGALVQACRDESPEVAASAKYALQSISLKIYRNSQ